MKPKRKTPRIPMALRIVQRHFPKVTLVNDAIKPAIIEVTPLDASSKAVKNPQLCAYARACQRKFNADGVIIGLTTSYIIRGATATRYLNPATVSREIVSFDRNAGFEEGSYLLSAVNPCRRLGVPHRGGQATGKATPRFRHAMTNVRVLA